MLSFFRKKRSKYGKVNLSRRYQKRRHPFFVGNLLGRKKKTRKRILKALLVLLILAFLSIIGFALFSGLFIVKDVVLNTRDSQTELTQKQVTFSLAENILHHNIFFVDNKDVTQMLRSDFPQIKNVQVQKVYPDTLNIGIDDYRMFAVLQHNSESGVQEYVMNEAGYISRKKESELSHLVRLQVTPSDPEISKKLLQANELAYLKGVQNMVRSKLIKAIGFMKILRVQKELHVLLENGWWIYFDMQQDYKAQIQNAISALSETDVDRDRIQYIDVRIPGKVFIKEE